MRGEQRRSSDGVVVVVVVVVVVIGVVIVAVVIVNRDVETRRAHREEMFLRAYEEVVCV
jgi:hypothetical protein